MQPVCGTPNRVRSAEWSRGAGRISQVGLTIVAPTVDEPDADLQRHWGKVEAARFTLQRRTLAFRYSVECERKESELEQDQTELRARPMRFGGFCRRLQRGSAGRCYDFRETQKRKNLFEKNKPQGLLCVPHRLVCTVPDRPGGFALNHRRRPANEN